MLSIERIDRWLIEVPYQRLVDASQRTPEWWAENAAFAMVISAWVELGLRGVATQPLDVFATVMMSIFAAIVISASRVRHGLARLLSTRALRHMVLVLTAMGSLAMLMREDPLVVLSIANSAAYLSIWYFAACTPPKPRRRRQVQLVPVKVR